MGGAIGGVLILIILLVVIVLLIRHKLRQPNVDASLSELKVLPVKIIMVKVVMHFLLHTTQLPK